MITVIDILPVVFAVCIMHLFIYMTVFRIIDDEVNYYVLQYLGLSPTRFKLYKLNSIHDLPSGGAVLVLIEIVRSILNLRMVVWFCYRIIDHWYVSHCDEKNVLLNKTHWCIYKPATLIICASCSIFSPARHQGALLLTWFNFNPTMDK